MKYQNVFERYEIKYLISKEQQIQIKKEMEPYMIGDSYGKNTLFNIYLDTPSYLLIRRSIERPTYKEKIRIRSYGRATPEQKVFIELKRKYRSIVYKRRIGIEEYKVMDFLRQNIESKQGKQSQIEKEIHYFCQQYDSLDKKVFLAYDREAFYQKDNRDFRVTFDENILWRKEDLSLCSSGEGEPLLKENQVLMEIKTGGAIPLWMTGILTRHNIYKTSFSKYGNAYRSMFARYQQEKKVV